MDTLPGLVDILHASCGDMLGGLAVLAIALIVLWVAYWEFFGEFRNGI
jgi:hypothetical protein